MAKKRIKVLHNITDRETGEAMAAGTVQEVSWDASRLQEAIKRGLVVVVPRARGSKSVKGSEDGANDISAISDQAG